MANWDFRAGTSPLWLDGEIPGIEKLRPVPVAADDYRQPDRVRPGLPVGQVDALAANPVPFEGDDFTEAAVDQHHQPNDGDDIGAPALVAGEHGVEPRDSLRRQIPVHRLNPVACRVPAEIGVWARYRLGSAMRIIMDRTGGAGLAIPGWSAKQANQSRTCSSEMASTVTWPKAGRMYLPTMQMSDSTVEGFQCRA